MIIIKFTESINELILLNTEESWMETTIEYYVNKNNWILNYCNDYNINDRLLVAMRFLYLLYITYLLFLLILVTMQHPQDEQL